jgi:hypothetical protein
VSRRPRPPRDPAGVLRAGLLLVASLSVVGTAVELAMERHWNTTVQLIPWAALAVITVGIAALVVRPTNKSIRGVRVLMAVVMLTALFGIWEHVDENYKAGPLDSRYSTTWDSMSGWSRWWAAATKAVGPSPVLAPAVLAEAGLCVALASIGLPVAVAEPTDERLRST